MKRISFLFSVFITGLILTSCNFIVYKGKNYCILKPGTHNLWGLNCERNDYNSAGPMTYTTGLEIIYATEYNAFGIDNGYDIYRGRIEFKLPRESGENYLSGYRGEELTFLNTPAQERGPIQIYSDYYDQDLYLVSTNRTETDDVTGDYNILGTYMNKYDKVKTFNFGGNTDEYNELYLCIDKTNSVLYFCSDKDGDFNIYSYNYDDKDNDDWIAILSSDDIKTKATPITTINTSANEECPYVYGDYLFFISDRADGLGGTDIYYSKKDDDGIFGTPINLGERVNTKYNEYRVSCYFFDNRTFGYTENPWQSEGFPDFVIFSSDRLGGLGGYDLYLSILNEIKVAGE
jgi:hypothetical protein